MKIIITGRHLEVTPALKSWVEDRAGHLTRYVSDAEEVEVTLWVDRFWHVAEVFACTGSSVFRAVTRSKVMYNSIDHAMKKIRQQARNNQGKRYHRRAEFHRRRPAAAVPSET